MKQLAGLALACCAVVAAAQQVSLSGVLGGKALLVVDGSAPKAVAAGESHKDVKVVSVSGDQAVLEAKGQRFTQRVGDSPASVGGAAAAAGGNTIVLQAGSGGHFSTNGRINGQTVQFMVDTGATVVSMSQSDAERLRLNYRAGEPFRANTANGQVSGWHIKLASVAIGDVQVYEVDAAVVPAAMPFILLGNSFLTRFQMRRDNDQMTLVKRF